MTDSLVWGSPEWLVPAILLVVVTGVLVAADYRLAFTRAGVRWGAALLKMAAVILLALFLCDPQWESVRPVPGANEFWVVADASESLSLRSASGTLSRGAEWLEAWQADSPWRARLEQDFRLRQFSFDTRLHPIADYETLDFHGTASNLNSALERLAQRVRHRPGAGLLLLSDGNATDAPIDPALLAQLPPIYCVVPSVPNDIKDLAIGQVQVTQSNFESTPITVHAEVEALGNWNERTVVQLIDADGREVERQTFQTDSSSKHRTVRFRFRPEQGGVQGYQVRVFPESEAADFETGKTAREATLDNNSRWLVVDRGGGPFRILYASGRSNWEFKFLRRSLVEDDEIDLVGLIRVAKREPRFTFRSRRGESSNPLYRGFDSEEEEAERFDQPVLIRLGTRDEAELQGGFPVERRELFQYHALIVDDLESEFFSADQHQLVRDFVTRRGGALLMMGGPDTFREGKYQDTPIGSIVPIYLDEVPTLAEGEESGQETFRMDLTREGWLEPWMRLQDTEAAERERLSGLPLFYNPSLVGAPRPGASLLAELRTADQQSIPMLITQRYGAGKTVALTTADLWRWQMYTDEQEDPELGLGQFWRQVVRWMVSDVTPRITPDVRQRDGKVHVTLDLVDAEYEPVSGAEVDLEVTTPDGAVVKLTAQPSTDQLGQYEVETIPASSGFFHATAIARFADEPAPVHRDLGWTWNPRRDELEQLVPNRQSLEQLAAATGGKVLEIGEMADALRDVSVTDSLVVQPQRERLWHRWWWLAGMLLGLAAEWGLRRYHGLA